VSQRYKRLDYTYDLISGNVRQVDYQAGYPDQMHHRYSYDADNRITGVETSADKVNWHTDADYFYYPHGPLERTELGQYKVQGVDYAYTLQGWLKGINGELLTPGNDMGQDGVAGTANGSVGRDAFGMSLGYYGNTDYTAVNTARWDNSGGQRPFAPQAWGAGEGYAPLYNGNIASAVYAQQPMGPWGSAATAGDAMASIYHYDQLNRLTAMATRSGITASANDWTAIPAPTSLKAYMSRYSYDGNGNLLTAQRYDGNGAIYDSLGYFYKRSGTQLLQNRLYHLQDHADPGNLLVNPGAGEEAQDIAYDNSAFANGTPQATEQDNNYRYDAMGNLVKDRREHIDSIAWTVAGKVRQVWHAPGSGLDSLRFAYGADGQRVLKEVGSAGAGSGYREYYIRDAQGNIMAMYRYTNSGPASLQVTERPLYGSKRLGSYAEEQQLLPATAVPANYAHPMLPAHTRYELADHLGNVRATVSGQLVPIFGPGLQYQAHLLSETAYEPFGSILEGKNYHSGVDRFGFNGQMKDDEVYGATGTSYTAEFWQYDPRIGRRWNVDPKTSALASWSPYHYGLNNPILFLDPDGQFPYTFHVRSFAPPNAFKGSGFHDDNRGFSTSTDVTSRIKQNFTIDPSARTYSGGNPTSDPTYWNGINMGRATNKGGISPPEFSTNSVGSAMASVSAAYEGSNPAFFGTAPNIAVSTSVSITENLKAGQVLVSLDISSKQFPATESFVQDAAGNSVFLAGAAAYGNALDLAKSDKTLAATIDLTIGISDKGIFQNVTMGGKTYSIDEFN
jgi:RHS repeat-associated protein